MARLKVDGVWGSKTEAAFCEVIGTYATGTPAVTRDTWTALRGLKVGAVVKLQEYLNLVYGHWKTLYTGSVWGPTTLPVLKVDGLFGWRTFQALINYAGWATNSQESMHLPPGGNHKSIELHISDNLRIMGMKVLQEFINAAIARRPMTVENWNVPGRIPHVQLIP